MWVIYHYHTIQGLIAWIVDQIALTEELAQEWIEKFGDSNIEYKYEEVETYFGEGEWQYVQFR